MYTAKFNTTCNTTLFDHPCVPAESSDGDHHGCCLWLGWGQGKKESIRSIGIRMMQVTWCKLHDASWPQEVQVASWNITDVVERSKIQIASFGIEGSCICGFSMSQCHLWPMMQLRARCNPGPQQQQNMRVWTESYCLPKGGYCYCSTGNREVFVKQLLTTIDYNVQQRKLFSKSWPSLF